MTDRVVLVLFALVALGAGAAVIVPLHNDLQANERKAAALKSGVGAIKAASVAQIMDKVENGSPAGARLRNLTVEPADATVIVVDPATGDDTTWSLDSDGKVFKGGSSSASDDHGVALTALDTAMPERLGREVLRRVGKPEGDLAQVTMGISPVAPHPITWAVELQHVPIRDRQWVADADGSHLHRND